MYLVDSIMKSTSVNLVRFFSVLSLSFLLFLTVSAQTDETTSTVTGETNSTDMLAIQLIVDTFSLTSDGDSCLPEPYSWLKCNSDDTPRITEIDLHGFLLSGVGLPNFSDLSALEKINIGDNILLDGEFPDFLANFPKLKVLYLVGTYFTGSVPTSLKKRADNKTLTLMLSGVGTDLCYSDEDVCPVKKKTETGKGSSPGTDEQTGVATSPGTDEKTSATGLTTPIMVAILFSSLVIYGAIVIVGFLTVRHQKKKAAATAGEINGTSGLSVPSYGNTMSPNPSLPGMNFQDLGSAAPQNILPDDDGVNIGSSWTLGRWSKKH